MEETSNIDFNKDVRIIVEEQKTRDFLKEYNPGLRKKLGAFYTPLPVVRFIVRSVDYLLEKEFGLADGLADTSKLPNGKHKVQILDPATGTGTFMSAAVQNIYKKLADKGQKGR